MIRTILVRVREQLDRRVILPDAHVDSGEFKTDIKGGFDRVILRTHTAQVKQHVIPGGWGGPGIAPSLNQHLLELHEDIRVEVGQTQHGDHGSHARRGTALLLEALLRDVEGLRSEGGELVVDEPAHAAQPVRGDAEHVHGVLAYERAARIQ